MWFITRLQMPVALMPIVGNIAMSNFLKAVWEEHIIVHQGLFKPFWKGILFPHSLFQPHWKEKPF